MRKLTYEQLERREVFATLAAVELPPSPLAVIESSTRDFIDSTLKQLAPSSNEAVLQTGPANVTSYEGGDQIQVTYVVVNIGSAIPSISSQQVVFTFTVRPNHAIGFRAALLRNLATPRSSFPPEVQLEAAAFVSLNSEDLPTIAQSTFLTEDSDATLSNLPEAKERQTRASSSRISGVDAPRSSAPLPMELTWQLLCSESTDSELASAERATTIRAFDLAQEDGDQTQPESMEDLKPEVLPISDRMSFLAEGPRTFPASQPSQTSNASAILQILVGLAGFPDPSHQDEVAVAVDQADLDETVAPSLSWKAWAVTIGIGFTLQNARHRERRSGMTSAGVLVSY